MRGPPTPEPIAGNRRAVASLYGVSVSTVIRWERQGALPPPVRMTPNGERLWDLDVLRQRFQRAAHREAA